MADQHSLPADLREFMDSGKYLPPPLRDFHDMKDTFKALHETVSVKDNDYCKAIGWVAGQCYVIDIFLWWMALHGYTLQRSRKALPFYDLSETVDTARDRRTTAQIEALSAIGTHD